ncbi:MAG: 4Fe-4S binding protein [Desulfomonilaceae bacterium]
MKLGSLRIAFQTVVFLLMFLIPLLNIYELYFLTGTYYALNAGGLGVSDPVVILQAMFASGHLTLPLLSAAVLPIMVAMIMGRVWCGWLCPYLFLADRVEGLRRFIKRRVFKIYDTSADKKNQGSFNANFVRFSFLIVGTAFGGMLGIPVLNYISAPGILSTEAMILVKERTLSIEIAFIVGVLGLQLTLLPRFWCRMFCPTGTLLSLIRTPYTLHLESSSKNQSSPCCKENPCSDACPMGLQPYSLHSA